MSAVAATRVPILLGALALIVARSEEVLATIVHGGRLVPDPALTGARD